MSSRAMGILIACLMLAVPPAAGQTDAGDRPAAGPPDEIRGIRQALDRMVDLLESVQRQQEVDLILKRIELRERRLEPLERRLRSAEAEVQGGEDHLNQLQLMKEQQEEILDREIREGTDDPLSGTRRMLDDIERSRKAEEARLELARLRVQQYENDLSRGRVEIEILDEMLAELVEALSP